MSGWYAIVSGQLGKSRLDYKDAQDIAPLAALGAWRYTQGIYSFHPDLFGALADTVPSGDLPVEVLLRLPEWCVYIATPTPAKKMDGFFAFLEHDTNDGRMELRIVGATGAHLVTAMPIHLGPWTVTEALDRARQEATKNAPELADMLLDDNELIETAGLMYPLISLLLYLCADDPDISGHVPGTYPQHPRPKKVKDGWRLFPPDKPRIWHIGHETGEKLRQAAEARHEPPAEATARRAHIRRAHWHGYWTGPRRPRADMPEEQQRRRFSYRWLHPMLVGTKEESDG
jgi:hypothetical protein